MLTDLSIRNFTLVDTLDIEFDQGLTAITGETGAGKSILLDALGLTLGERADYTQIRQGCKRAEVTAVFDLSNNPSVRATLEQSALDVEEPQCIFRRVISSSGKSQAWVNGHAVTLQQMREFAQPLINIHSQHEHQNLVKKSHHLKQLDKFGQYSEQLQAVSDAYAEWHSAHQSLQQLRADLDSHAEKHAILSLQNEDLKSLALVEGELDALESEQSLLANAESLLSDVHQILQYLDENEQANVQQLLGRATHTLDHLPAVNEALRDAQTMLTDASIQVAEAVSTMRHAQQSIELDPQQLQNVEARLTAIYDTARKWRTQPEQLITLQQRVSEELDALDDPDAALATQQQRADAAWQVFVDNAQTLSQARSKAAKQLAQQINARFDALSMSGAAIRIDVTPDTNIPASTGIDQVSMKIRTNPGQDFGDLAKVASGGELSRVSLAIQVVTAQRDDTPILVFDEVDVGIGGKTARVVGKMLQELSGRAQVLCITHLAQVAAHAAQQLKVSKTSKNHATHSHIDPVLNEHRVREIARMMSGDDMSENALSSASELLDSSH